ncbi:hypothetical protein BV25DRAFT_1666578 [Artomyces pyxidatus]|uniref:Uncharacterized protein n=1 Tax=Artomyces pyxidatus TaxID=48021 RepID=A0ACB8SJA4_9AGAM|nr:hypothetical protein BV25DRAFT_1666578 [Artomyces pyxidatus]
MEFDAPLASFETRRPKIIIPGGDPGALLIGIVFASVLYGMTSQQTVFYFAHFQDTLIIRVWVAVLWVLETVTTVFESLVINDYFIHHYGHIGVDATNDTYFSVSSITTGCIIFLVQIFFIVRIRKLRNTVYPTSIWNNVVFVFFIILAVFSFSTSIQLTYYDIASPDNPLRQPVYIANVSVETALDLFITISLVVILHQHRNEFAKKKNPIEQLIMFFTTRGIVLTLFQISMLIIPYSLPGDYSFFAIYTCFSKIYVNSALVTLNNRQRFLQHGSGNDAGSHRCTSMEFTIPDLNDSYQGSVEPIVTVSPASPTPVYSGIDSYSPLHDLPQVEHLPRTHRRLLEDIEMSSADRRDS